MKKIIAVLITMKLMKSKFNFNLCSLLYNNINNEGVTIGGGNYNTYINDRRVRLPTNESIESSHSGQFTKYGPMINMNLNNQLGANENRQFFFNEE